MMRHLPRQSWGFTLAMLVAVSGVIRAEDVFPPFSWDRVPVYAHLGKSSGDFTPAELDFLATRYDFIAIEKGQAVQTRGDTEAGIAEVVRQIKQRNPDAKVLFYWNAFLDYPLYRASRGLPDDWHLKNRDGRPVLIRGSVPAYDLAREDVRAWWSDAAATAVQADDADGIFADALLQVAAPAKRTLLGDEKYGALNDGLIALLEETRRKIGPDALLLYNGLRGKDGAQFLPYTHGAMIEHFGHFASASKEAMAEDLEQMRLAARSGKIVCLKAWPGFSWLDKDILQQPRDQRVQLARDRIVFPLACFLVAAESHCYFCYTWGYREDDGTFDWYPEFDRPLGPPQGDATRVGWTYKREFDHAVVAVDLESRTATIDWR